MNESQSQPKPRRNKWIKKFYLSAFVVISFTLYALEKPFNNASAGQNSNAQLPNPQVAQLIFTLTAPPPTSNPSTLIPPTSSPPAADQPTATESPQPVVLPTDTPVPPPTANKGIFKDGTYNGPEIDAFYGLVRVQTIIRNGKIANVQFLEYPSDRRTSVRINNFAVPLLQQEAIQAQTANVDFISGATLTSQAFEMSLQSALNQAKN